MADHKRGRLYVDKDVQRALLWQLFRHWTVFIGVLLGMLLVLQALEAGPRLAWSEHCRAVWSRNAPLLVVVAALFPVFAYDSMKLSHRFVGPIMRLRRTLRQAALGERVPALVFRTGDYWQDLADSFNALMERVPADSADASSSEEAQPAKREALALAGQGASGVAGGRSHAQ